MTSGNTNDDFESVGSNPVRINFSRKKNLREKEQENEFVVRGTTKHFFKEIDGFWQNIFVCK